MYIAVAAACKNIIEREPRKSKGFCREINFKIEPDQKEVVYGWVRSIKKFAKNL